MEKKTYKVTRLRDGVDIDLDAPHALNLLRLNATYKKSEYALNEKQYLFGNNEIYKRPNNRGTKGTEVQS